MPIWDTIKTIGKYGALGATAIAGLAGSYFAGQKNQTPPPRPTLEYTISGPAMHSTTGTLAHLVLTEGAILGPNSVTELRSRSKAVTTPYGRDGRHGGVPAVTTAPIGFVLGEGGVLLIESEVDGTINTTTLPGTAYTTPTIVNNVSCSPSVTCTPVFDPHIIVEAQGPWYLQQGMGSAPRGNGKRNGKKFK